MMSVKSLLDTGAQFAVKCLHNVETCNLCTWDADNNGVTRSKPSPPQEGGESRMLLLPGTCVSVPKVGRRIDGEVIAVAQDEDPDSRYFGMECYVVEFGNGGTMTYPVEMFEDDWVVSAPSHNKNA
jgi:hypothetical protein